MHGWFGAGAVAFHQLTASFAKPVVPEPTPPCHELQFAAMVERSCAAMRDHGTLEMI